MICVFVSNGFSGMLLEILSPQTPSEIVPILPMLWNRGQCYSLPNHDQREEKDFAMEAFLF